MPDQETPRASVKDLDSQTIDTSSAEYEEGTASEAESSQAAFIEALEDAGYEMRTYSGRGMYGVQCVSVALDCDTPIWAFVCDVLTQASLNGAAEVATMAEQLRGLSYDELGRGQVVYWPEIPWPEGRSSST
jgi:hypothetical protein